MSLNSPKIEINNLSKELQYALLDLEEFASFFGVSDKRIIEKEAALYMVRKVLKDQNLTILYQESGRPYLANGIKISISHSYDWITVLFSTSQEVGIDIEKVRDKILKIKTKFLSEQELLELEAAPIEKYTLYWSAKEALYKACGISGLIFAEQLHIEPFKFCKEGGEIIGLISHPDSEKKHTLQYRVLNDYMIVYTDNDFE